MPKIFILIRRCHTKFYSIELKLIHSSYVGDHKSLHKFTKRILEIWGRGKFDCKNDTTRRHRYHTYPWGLKSDSTTNHLFFCSMRVFKVIGRLLGILPPKRTTPPLNADALELVMNYLPVQDQLRLSLAVCYEWRQIFLERRRHLDLTPDTKIDMATYNLVSLPYENYAQYIRPSRSITKYTIQAFPNLTHLYLVECKLHYKALSSISKLEHLVYLDISGAFFLSKKSSKKPRDCRKRVIKSLNKNLEYIATSCTLEYLVFVSPTYCKMLDGKQIMHQGNQIKNVSLYRFNSPITALWWNTAESMYFKCFGRDWSDPMDFGISMTLKHLHVDVLNVEHLAQVVHSIPYLTKLSYVYCSEEDDVELAKLTSLNPNMEVVKYDTSPSRIDKIKD